MHMQSALSSARACSLQKGPELKAMALNWLQQAALLASPEDPQPDILAGDIHFQVSKRSMTTVTSIFGTFI